MNFKDCHEAHKWLVENKIDQEKIAFDKLTGKYKHYCTDWDDMAIDENCIEFSSCGCYANDPIAQEIQTNMWDEWDADYEREALTEDEPR